MGGRRKGLRGTGDTGEDIALEYLLGLGYRLERRNFQTRSGEIDMILYDGTTLVFAEVKYRRGEEYGHPLDAVTPRKQGKMFAVAEEYIAIEEPEFDEVRFDVVGITGGRTREIFHVRDAFQG